MSKKFIKFSLLAFILIFTLMPAFSFAQNPPSSGLVPCGTERNTDGSIKNPCGFDDIFTLVNNVVNFILFALAVPIAAIMFAYAGFLMLTGGGSEEKAKKARKIFTNVAIGLIFIAGAWLIVNTILSILGYDGSWIGF